MATIKYKNHFWNYDRVSEISFHHKEFTYGDDWIMNVWHYGKYTEIFFKTEEEYLYAQKKLEEGLISGYILIDIEMQN